MSEPAKELKPAQLRALIESDRLRFEAGLSRGSLTPHGWRDGERQNVRIEAKLHDQVAWRRAHFFNMAAVDPVLPDPYDDAPSFQSDAPRQRWIELKARITENPPVVRVEHDETTTVKREAAQAIEQYMNDLLDDQQKRLDQTLIEAMADAQIIDGVGLLHWREAPDRMEAWPDYEYRDDLRGTDPETKRRYRGNPEYTEGSDDPKHRQRLRETTDSLNERRKQQLAMSPAPYETEMLPARSCYWVNDRSALNGLGRVMVIRELGYTDYEDAANEALGAQELKVILKDNKLRRVHIDEDAPDRDSPSWDGYNSKVSLVTIWTKTHWYELAALDNGGVDEWEFVQSGEHDWGMPPFAIVTAIQVADPDPTLSFQPALAGMYRLKPFIDEMVTLMHVMARNVAMPWFYLESTKDGTSLLNEDGSVVRFTADVALGMKVPDGYTLKWVDTQLNNAYPQSLGLMREDFQASFPATGTTDTTASSQPWTVRLKQQEANVTPRKLVDRMIQPLDIWAESIVRHCAKRALMEPDDSLWMYYGKSGAKKLVGVSASDLEDAAAGRGFRVHVGIDATSAAEKVTEMQLGMELLQMGLITEYQFWDEFAGDPEPQKRIDEGVAERAFKTYWEPGIIRQEIARIQGTETVKNVVVGAEGEIIGPNGQQMQPGEAAAANGFQNVAPQPPAAPPIGGMTAQQPGMGILAPQGAVPIQAGV